MDDQIEIREERTSDLTEYAQIPAVFEVRNKASVEFKNGRYLLSVSAIGVPFTKYYDKADDPLKWPARFDLSRWGQFAAFAGERRAGGAIVAYDTPGVEMLEERQDLVVIWDLRVLPEVRRSGIGTALFEFAEDWGRARGCRELKVETQDINVPACRFYAQRGCTLTEVNRHAYPQHLDEAQLIWRKPL